MDFVLLLVDCQELACLGTSQVLTDWLCPGWVGISQAWFWAIAPHLTSPRHPDPRDISPGTTLWSTTKVGRLTLPRFLASSLLDYGAPVICGTRWRSGDGANQLSHFPKSNINTPSPVAYLLIELTHSYVALILVPLSTGSPSTPPSFHNIQTIRFHLSWNYPKPRKQSRGAATASPYASSIPRTSNLHISLKSSPNHVP